MYYQIEGNVFGIKFWQMYIFINYNQNKNKKNMEGNFHPYVNYSINFMQAKLYKAKKNL